MDKRSQGYYRNVPGEQVDQLMRFREAHPLKTAVIGKVGWEYLTGGNPSGASLLFLPGALSTAESAWRSISLLEQCNYRLIVPNYPAELDRMSSLADGLGAILDQENIESTFLVGGSYGGMLAQVFVHRHPELISKLVLSHTYPPVPRRARNVEPAMLLFRIMPLPMLKRVLSNRMIGILPPHPTPELLLIAAQVRETVDSRLTRQAALSTYARMLDFDRQTFNPTDLSGWQGKILIMLAEDDPTTPEQMRKALLGLYPGAKVHIFKGSGHATSALDSADYIKVIDEFLKG